jgi:chorismate synthase
MNTFGRIFRISIFGESHGSSVGIIIDGTPPGIPLSDSDFVNDIDRRRGGKKGTTPRKDADNVIIKSGVFNGKSTGAPICLEFENSGKNSEDYESGLFPRPGHADFTSHIKYGGYADYRGGGHFSGRLTVGLVAAGVIAKKIINPVKIESEIIEIGGNRDFDKALDEAIQLKDSIGGIVECRAIGLPVGLGEPFFDSVESLISHIVFSIPAIKGIEFGSGFGSARMKGSENNDIILNKSGKTATNNAGGINGGITNGNDLVFRVAVKSTPSIGKEQSTIDLNTGKKASLQLAGRFDTCIALRVPVVLEAATAIVLADLKMLVKK